MGKIIPITFITILLITFDIYIYKAILSIYPKWSDKQKKRFKIIWWSYTILLILGVYVSIFFNIALWLRAIILVAFFMTFVSKLFFIPVLLIDDIKRLLTTYKRRNERKTPIKTNEIPRSEFLVKAGMAVAAIPFTTLSWGIVSGAHDYRIRKQIIKLPNLPSSFNGMTIAQISDVHSGSFYNRTAVLGGVELLMAQKPDMAFFTGDLVNGRANEMREYQDIFSKIKAPLGVYSCLGNHDYGLYERWPNQQAQNKNLQDIITTHKNMGWNLLLNENRSVKINNEEIGILGVENWGGGRFPKFGKVEDALKNTDDLPVKLLLSHDPSHWRLQILKDYPEIDVMFAGHTHGMQFGVETENFKWSPAKYIYNEWDGLYQENNQQLYVNVGFGFLGYPGRIGILPEITLFELQKG